VLSIVKNAHEKAKKIIRENEAKMHELSEYLIKKETITGEEFMRILEDKN
jgi:cell division protease FtsH